MTTTNLDTLTTEQLEMELKKRKAALTKEKKTPCTHSHFE